MIDGLEYDVAKDLPGITRKNHVQYLRGLGFSSGKCLPSDTIKCLESRNLSPSFVCEYGGFLVVEVIRLVDRRDILAVPVGTVVLSKKTGFIISEDFN